MSGGPASPQQLGHAGSGRSGLFRQSGVGGSQEEGGDAAIKGAWIDKQLNGTSVTVVLIGAETAARDYVKYEITQSWAKGNRPAGPVYPQPKRHFPKDRYQRDQSVRSVDIQTGGRDGRFDFEYDWVNDDGYNNLGTWIEAAAKAAGR